VPSSLKKKEEQMRIIDCHMHINFNKITSKNFINYLNKNNIDMCWLMTWEEANVKKWPYQNLNIEDICEAYYKNPERIKIMYAPVPLAPDFHDRFLKIYNNNPVFGYGELKSTIKWNEKKIDEMLSLLDGLKIPLNFHMENYGWKFIEFDKITYSGQIVNMILHSKFVTKISNKILPIIDKYIKIDKFKYTYYFPGYMLDFANLELRLQKYSKLIFIAHGPLFWANISEQQSLNKYPSGKISKKGIICELLLKYNNLFVDISGISGYNALTRDKDFIKYFLEKFNKQILFGTDTYELNQKTYLDSLNLSKEIYENIYYKNALNLMEKNEK